MTPATLRQHGTSIAIRESGSRSPVFHPNAKYLPAGVKATAHVAHTTTRSTNRFIVRPHLAMMHERTEPERIVTNFVMMGLQVDVDEMCTVGRNIGNSLPSASF